jgi:hypothetical protein
MVPGVPLVGSGQSRSTASGARRPALPHGAGGALDSLLGVTQQATTARTLTRFSGHPPRHGSNLNADESGPQEAGRGTGYTSPGLWLEPLNETGRSPVRSLPLEAHVAAYRPRITRVEIAEIVAEQRAARYRRQHQQRMTAVRLIREASARLPHACEVCGQADPRKQETPRPASQGASTRRSADTESRAANGHSATPHQP